MPPSRVADSVAAPETFGESGWFPRALAEHGERVALLTETDRITYAQLGARVQLGVERLGPRRLVLLAATNHPDSVVLYLAALAGGHPVILVDADSDHAVRNAIRAYDPDVIAAPAAGSTGPWIVEERREQTRHELHPDLALLLSTSGSTGSPKLVRLSRTNVQANAEAIASYLSIGSADRAITTLPMAYCYGLSVINSHLCRGASVVLSERSVIDPEFWRLLGNTHATSFAGVPYTFELLDRVGFADMTLPHLRYVTQAGGRLEPGTVRRYAELSRRRGWELYVMYGQTEATARMAYLPPGLAATHPGTIGVPIPGGSIRIDPVAGAPDGTGELVYRGPNVMLGYAEGPSDLGRGRSIEELRTGDVGRWGPDGLLEIVGRRERFLKIAGLRIELDGIEQLVARHGAPACAVGTDDELVVVTEPSAPRDLDALVRRTAGLPAHAVRVVVVPELPRLANGKIDRASVERLAAEQHVATHQAADTDTISALRDLYETALGMTDVADNDSFATLGGDSLSYVEITLGLEEILGRLPDGWATMTLRQLAQHGDTPEPTSRVPRLLRWRSVEMSVALRAVAIVLVVATHIGMIAAPGGAHVLMAVAGFNFARFRLTMAPRAERLDAQLRAIVRIALPAMAWVALAMLLLGEYELRYLLLVNAIVTDEMWGNLWFIELLIYINLAMAALLAVPAIERAERRWPFGASLVVLGMGLLFRYEIVDFGILATKPVLWLFGIGWAASRATRTWQRALILVVALVSVPGYFESWERNAVIAAGLVLLIGVPRIPIPGVLARVGGVLAGASLYIYLVHWEVWPMFQGWYGMPSLVASLAAGIALWLLVPRITAQLAALRPSASDWQRIRGALVGRARMT